MRFCLRSALLTGLALFALTCLVAGPDDWPGWRGPSSNGISQLKNLPSAWSHDQNVAWKAVGVVGGGELGDIPGLPTMIPITVDEIGTVTVPNP